jgi:hypothetical protein
MNAYTQIAQPEQLVLDEPELLSVDDILPTEFDLLTAEDQTVGMACLMARSTGLAHDDDMRRWAILCAWETGAMSGIEAHDMLMLNDLLDFDALMGLYAGFVRATARAEAL